MSAVVALVLSASMSYWLIQSHIHMRTQTTPTHSVQHSSHKDFTEQLPLPKTHLVPMVAPLQSRIYTQKEKFWRV